MLPGNSVLAGMAPNPPCPPQISCEAANNLPDLIFHIHGKEFPVPPRAYVLRVSIPLGMGLWGSREGFPQLLTTPFRVLGAE